MGLLYLIFRQWKLRPGRCALSVISLAIALASVVGTMLSQQSVRSNYRRLSEKVEGAPALDVIAEAGGRFAVSDAPALTDINGASDVISLATRAGMIRAGGQRVQTVIVGLSAPSPKSWGLIDVTQGRPPASRTEALIAAELAESLHVELGDRIVLLTRRGPRSLNVVGLSPAASLGALAPGTTTVLALSTLQEFFGLAGQVDRLRIVFDSAAARTAAELALGESLPESFAVQRPVGQMALADSLVRSTELALQFAGALSVVMAAFIVLNSLRMNFGERRKELATLRALGATSEQLAKLQIVEGAMLGAFGTCLGIPLGILLGRGLSLAMGRLIQSEVSTPELSIDVWLPALAIGPLVAAAAAIVPAWQAKQLTAREALEGVPPQPPESFNRWSALAGLICWLAAVAMLAGVITERLTSVAAIPAGLLMLLGFIMSMPVCLGPFLRLAARWAEPMMNIEGEIAAGQLLRNRTRTSLTAGVMIVAVSNGLGLGNAVLNNVDEVRQWYRRSAFGDFFLVDANVGASATPNRLADSLAENKSIETASRAYFLQGQINGAPAMCIVRDFPAVAELPWNLDEGDATAVRRDLNQGMIVLGHVLARKLKVAAGDDVRVELQGRVVPFRVSKLVNDYNLGGMVAFFDREAVEKTFDLGTPDLWMIKRSPDAPAEALASELAALAGEHRLTLQSNGEMRSQLDQLMNGVVGALWGLLAIGVVIAAIAIANTLTMSIMEQTRELGLLRIVGLTQRQLRKLVFSQALLLGLFAALCGGLAGVTTAWVIHLCSIPLLGYAPKFTLEWWLVAVNVAGCVLVALAAAWFPARRASQLNLLEAIAYE